MAQKSASFEIISINGSKSKAKVHNEREGEKKKLSRYSFKKCIALNSAKKDPKD